MRTTSFASLIKFILANGSLILSIVLTVFIILDRFNPMMGFVSSIFSQSLFVALIICASLLAIVNIIEYCNKK